jgi:DNA-directed RNA polymerase specialized sigma24 family protein
MYIDGATEVEMAETLGITTSAVGVRIHRIKQKLKKWKTL